MATFFESCEARGVSDVGYAFDEKGLLPAVLQDRVSGRVLMVAWMNAEAVRLTRETGEAHFFSRTRQALWRKGETSGHSMRVREVLVDCDLDTILVLVDPAGPACHTGARSCFFRDEEGEPAGARGGTEVERLEETILERQATGSPEHSYTKMLFEGGTERIGLKVREEAGELATAIAAETTERVVREAADVTYHLLVALASRGVSWREVLEELARRAGVSGLEEKARR